MNREDIVLNDSDSEPSTANGLAGDAAKILMARPLQVLQSSSEPIASELSFHSNSQYLFTVSIKF